MDAAFPGPCGRCSQHACCLPPKDHTLPLQDSRLGLLYTMHSHSHNAAAEWLKGQYGDHGFITPLAD